MSFIYALQSYYNSVSTVYDGIALNISNGTNNGIASYAPGSAVLKLANSSRNVLFVDPIGQTSLNTIWEDASVVYNNLTLDASNRNNTPPLGASTSKLIRGTNTGVSVFSVDALGLISSSNINYLDLISYIPIALRANVQNFTSGSDVSDYVQNAINDAIVSGKIIYASPGRYIMGKGVSATKQVYIIGAGNGCGPGAAAISNSQVTQFFCAFFAGDLFAFTTNFPCMLANFQVNTTVPFRPRTSGASINISGPVGSTNANSKIFNVGMTNQYDCVNLTSIAMPEIAGCYADSFVHSFANLQAQLGIESSGGAIRNNFIFGTSGSTTQEAGIILGIGYTVVSQNLILGSKYGIKIAIVNSEAGTNDITDNFIENQGILGILVSTVDGTRHDALAIERNEFSNIVFTTSFIGSIKIEDFGAGTEWISAASIRNNKHRHQIGATVVKYIWVQTGKLVSISNEQLSNNTGAAGTNLVGIDLATGATAALKAPFLVKDTSFLGNFLGGKYLGNANAQIFDSQGLTFAELPTAANGSRIFVTDGTVANPVANGGTGCIANLLNGIWRAI